MTTGASIAFTSFNDFAAGSGGASDGIWYLLTFCRDHDITTAHKAVDRYHRDDKVNQLPTILKDMQAVLGDSSDIIRDRTANPVILPAIWGSASLKSQRFAPKPLLDARRAALLEGYKMGGQDGRAIITRWEEMEDVCASPIPSFATAKRRMKELQLYVAIMDSKVCDAIRAAGFVFRDAAEDRPIRVRLTAEFVNFFVIVLVREIVLLAEARAKGALDAIVAGLSEHHMVVA